MAVFDLTQTSNFILHKDDIVDCPYSGTYKILSLKPGRYKLECWGAEGGKGYNNGGIGGRGGYSYGILNLSSSTSFQLYSGGKGEDGEKSTANGGWNGGGASLINTSLNSTSGGGGGASDIRINSTSLYARVIVAGGGGGGGCYDTDNDGNAYGGYGGGLQGQDGGDNNTPGEGGTQTEGASFGIGENGISVDNTTTGAGGGGGWYGGFGSKNGSGVHNGGGGGGSGYVYTSSTASNYPSGCLLNSEYYLTNAETIAGNESFLSPLEEYETGHSGNGYIRITVLNISGEYDITTDTIPSNLQIGDVINCPYSGTYKTLILKPGQYKLECWGAQGGYNTDVSDYEGAKGGYSVGTLTLNTNTTLYLYAGGQGGVGKTSGITVVGGFNGGGTAHTSAWGRGSGGGASDIRINSDSLYSRVIVAGGAGGSTGETGGMTTAVAGGVGGGLNGGDGTNVNGTIPAILGAGGTQTAAGTHSTVPELNGSFGIGGSASSNNVAGGGGGWYGGAAGNSSGGGSGYVYTSSTASNYPSGCLLNSEYYLTNAETIAGNESFLSPLEEYETGHSGNGYIRITVIFTEAKPYSTIYSKINNNWKETLDLFFKYNNNWINCSELKIKINNTWK